MRASSRGWVRRSSWAVVQSLPLAFGTRLSTSGTRSEEREVPSVRSRLGGRLAACGAAAVAAALLGVLRRGEAAGRDTGADASAVTRGAATRARRRVENCVERG